MLGIEGYEPIWQHDAQALAAAHRARFQQVIGQPLVGSWLMWDLDAHAWFTGGPVVLGFPDANIEITHRKFDECAISWDTIDMQAPVEWPGLRLDWWSDTHPTVVSARGRELRAVNLIERVMPAHWRPTALHAVELIFDGLRLELFNAMDENGISGEPEVVLPVGRWTRIPIA
ncbi:hypothetical protein HDA40_004460 [Hamadaea flava]|uniref:Uncharacterized protein n=1 Tax=Hamadaea flava TaxID=1742688 RepID=A0ABV8LFF2_9ACTN|nr:hypothetical protein [Hamadaea flava]MCP2325953.1 hypothetical protein [Hamadaea flava]